MKFLSTVLILIIFTVAVLFIIEKSDTFLLTAIVVIIAGFWYAVLTIPKEKDRNS